MGQVTTASDDEDDSAENDAGDDVHAGDDAHAGDAVEVGDTPADTVMGRAAGLGLTVGVLRFFTGISILNIF